MRALMFAATALIAAGAATFASGQTGSDTVPVSSSYIYNACVQNNQGPPLECACMAGFYGGRLEQEEFRLIAVLNRYVDNTGAITNMAAVQQALRDEARSLGMSDERFQQAMQRFAVMDQDGAYGDRVCAGMRTR